MRIALHVDAAESLVRNVAKQIDYAVSRSINETLKDAQSAIRRGVAERFTIRRKTWIEQSIKISKFATRQDPRAVFGIDPRRDVLAKFERGGIKRAEGGRVAVPLAGARPTKQAIVPAPLRPRRLGEKAFVLRTRRGQELLVQTRKAARAVGRDWGFLGNRKLRLLYVLKSGVPIRPMLRFVSTTEEAFARRFSGHFRREFAQAIKTAR